jgi:hypothetical protein
VQITSTKQKNQKIRCNSHIDQNINNKFYITITPFNLQLKYSQTLLKDFILIVLLYCTKITMK